MQAFLGPMPRLLLCLLLLALGPHSRASASDACRSPSNAIVRENCLPGSPSTEWDVNAEGSEDIQGFSTSASLAVGERVEFKLKTTYREPFRVDIWRLGWYGGDGARRVGSAALVAGAVDKAASQPPCGRHPVALHPDSRASHAGLETDLVDCGNWASIASFDVPLNATSGVYFARLVLTGARDPSGNWRVDKSSHLFDPVHAMVGHAGERPDGSLPHAYGANGATPLRNALREPRASHAWFVVRAEDRRRRDHGLAAAAAAAAAETTTQTTSENDDGDDVRHDLLFQTSDTTAHAYNGYGGFTTYGTYDYPFEHWPSKRALNLSDPAHMLRRSFKRSYNTPLITRGYRAVNAPLGAEYPAIRFLERSGYDLHYASGADMSLPTRAARLLARSRGYLSVGHDEYWSYEQRAAVEYARDAHGVHLSFWSGNEAYWAIRWEQSVHGGGGDEKADDDDDDDDDEVLPRTLVVYKETQSMTKLDPVEDTWTGTFRDARAINPKGALPENALTGTMMAANALRSDPLIVDAVKFGRHRAWRHTSVAEAAAAAAAAAADGTATAAAAAARPAPLVLCQGTNILGHEWDHDLDNGYRPHGLQRLSEWTHDNVQTNMDHGSTFDSGSCTHALTLYRKQPQPQPQAQSATTPETKAGALTFGAGTVQWSWGLDEHHDVNAPHTANKYNTRVLADPRGACRDVQQFTTNVFADMGILPTTPIAGLVVEERKERKGAGAGAGAGAAAGATAARGPAVYLASASYAADGVVRAAGWAQEEGVEGAGSDGVVAAVEVSFGLDSAGEQRWHPAVLSRLAPGAKWSFSWGEHKWHYFHGAPPAVGGPDDDSFMLLVRAVDDSGRMGPVGRFPVYIDGEVPESAGGGGGGSGGDLSDGASKVGLGAHAAARGADVPAGKTMKYGAGKDVGGTFELVTARSKLDVKGKKMVAAGAEAGDASAALHCDGTLARSFFARCKSDGLPEWPRTRGEELSAGSPDWHRTPRGEEVTVR